MIIYNVLGTAPLGADRLAGIHVGNDQWLIAWQDADRHHGLLSLSDKLIQRAEAFHHPPPLERRRLKRP